MMGYQPGGAVLWPGVPDWSQPVVETLQFATDVMQASAGAQSARALLDTPRRAFAFQQRQGLDDAQFADTIIDAAGMYTLWLPIYPDVLWLAASVVAGTDEIFVDTTGRDFVAGGTAVFWNGINAWELATIDAVAPGSLTFTAPLGNDWPAGARLYPARRARLTGAAQASYQSDVIATRSATLQIDAASAWPAAWPTDTMYRTMPVLEWRNEESDDPTAEYDRLTTAIDNTVSPAYIVDVPGTSFRAQSQRFALYGRAKHTAFRSLLYALNGRENACWVPSWLADARLTAPCAASATTLAVANMGLAATGGPRMNRQDLTIELFDGTRIYRRVTGVSAAGGAEALTLDSAPGVALSTANVRSIGWLRLCASASDTFQIQHQTDADGVGIAAIGWQAVANDL